MILAMPRVKPAVPDKSEFSCDFGGRFQWDNGAAWRCPPDTVTEQELSVLLYALKANPFTPLQGAQTCCYTLSSPALHNVS